MGKITKQDMVDSTLQVHGAGEYVSLTYAMAVIEQLESGLDGHKKQIASLCDQVRELQETKPGEYCCCGECQTS